MTFKEIVMARNATKSFDGKKIPQEKVEELLDIIRHAATSFNVQPWRVMIIEDDDRKNALAGAAMNQPQGANRLAWAQRQTYLALGNGINGAKALGFDSCPMEGFEPDKFAKILGLPETLVPTALMTIGHAHVTPRPKLRFSREQMFFEKV